MALEARFHDRIADIPKEAWDALVGDGSPFLEWEWLHALEESRCVSARAGWVPRHLTIHRGGELVAACPVYVKGNSEGEFVFDWSWADLAQRMGLEYYPKLVVGVPFTPVAGQRVLVAPGEPRGEFVAVTAEALRQFADAIGASSVHVLFPLEDEIAAWTDSGFQHRLGFQFQWRNQGYATFDDFLAQFTSKRRHQIRREVAQPAKDGTRLVALAPGAITPELRRAMFGFYANTVDKFFYGRRYLNAPFFERIVDRFADRLAWVVAFDGDEPIAGAFNVRKGARLYGRYWGATRDVPFLHFNVCYYEGIRRCIEDGLEVFEPGAGGEHKYARGFLPTLTHSVHHVRDPKMARIVGSFLEREREAVVAHVAEAREDGPFKTVTLEAGVVPGKTEPDEPVQ